MGKDPAVLFYTADFIIGTAFLTHEKVGKYIRLLCYQHQMGRMTKNQVLSITGIWEAEIMNKFEEKDGLFYNKRMEEEKEKRVSYCKSRNNNKKGVNQYSRSYDHHMTGHMENENEDIKRTTIQPIINKIAQKKKIPFTSLPPKDWKKGIV